MRPPPHPQGGLYAPSIFIGAALGSAFGLLAHALGDPLGLHLSAPQAYALVGEPACPSMLTRCASRRAYCREPPTAQGPACTPCMHCLPARAESAPRMPCKHFHATSSSTSLPPTLAHPFHRLCHRALPGPPSCIAVPWPGPQHSPAITSPLPHLTPPPHLPRPLPCPRRGRHAGKQLPGAPHLGAAAV